MGHGLGNLAEGATSALVAPLRFRHGTQGLLVAFDRLTGGPAFEPDDEYLLSSFAASAAIAIATAKTVEDERLRNSVEASEQERRRWARELHDETLQELGALKVLLESARQSDRQPVVLGCHRPCGRSDPALDQRASGPHHRASPRGAGRAGHRPGPRRPDQAHRRHVGARDPRSRGPRVRAGTQCVAPRGGGGEHDLPAGPGVAHERDQARRRGAGGHRGDRGRRPGRR